MPRKHECAAARHKSGTTPVGAREHSGESPRMHGAFVNPHGCASDLNAGAEWRLVRPGPSTGRILMFDSLTSRRSHHGPAERNARGPRGPADTTLHREGNGPRRGPWASEGVDRNPPRQTCDNRSKPSGRRAVGLLVSGACDPRSGDRRCLSAAFACGCCRWRANAGWHHGSDVTHVICTGAEDQGHQAHRGAGGLRDFNRAQGAGLILRSAWCDSNRRMHG